MKNKILLLIFVIISIPFCLLLSQDYQDWKWLHPQPQGNTLRYVKMWDTANWYAVGINGTFMKTSDAGRTWYFNHKASGVDVGGTGLPQSIYDAWFFNKDTGLTMGFGGMNITFNAGKTFSTVTSVSSASIWSHFYFLNRKIGYAACSWPGEYAKTTDGGLSWTTNSNGPPVGTYDVWSPNDTLILLAANDGNVYRSINGGISFRSVPAGFSSPINRMKFWNDSTGLVVSNLGNASLTSNGGLTWTPANNGLPNSTFNDIGYSNNTLYVTGDPNYLYKSTNLGLAWDTVGILWNSSVQPATDYYYATDFYANSFVTVGLNGLINSRNGNNPPVVVNNLFKTGSIYDLWVSPDRQKIISVGWPTSNAVNDQIMLSTDGGSNWNISTLNSNSALYSLNMINEKTGFAVGLNGIALQSEDGGFSWSSITSIVSTDNFTCVDFINEQIGWIFSSSNDAKGTIWKTTDGGNSWIQSVLTGTSGSAGAIISASIVNNNIGWVLTNSPSYPYKTTDGGLTWTKQSVGSPSGLYKIQMLDSLVGYCSGTGKLYKTRNGGLTWSLIPYPFIFPRGTFSSLTLNVVDSNTVFIAGDAGLTAESIDGGFTWKEMVCSNGQSTRGLYTVSTIDTVFAFCGSNNGDILKAAIKKSVINGINETLNNGIPVKFELFQNYPNPFNPDTKINFSLPYDSKVTLKIYNLLGQQVSVLVDGNINMGYHSVNFDAAKLPSGVYLYRLEASGYNGFEFSFVRKMILIK